MPISFLSGDIKYTGTPDKKRVPTKYIILCVFGTPKKDTLVCDEEWAIDFPGILYLKLSVSTPNSVFGRVPAVCTAPRWCPSHVLDLCRVRPQWQRGCDVFAGVCALSVSVVCVLNKYMLKEKKENIERHNI